MITRRNSLALAIPLALIALLATVAVALAAADGSGSKPHPGRRPAAFTWLHPEAVPQAWRTLRLPGSGAGLSAPASWEPARSDPGTKTLVSRGPAGAIIGYLNATPRQGDESAADWASFRVAHNRGEGDREVRLLASARDLPFRSSATGSCVIDSYLTSSGNRYREIACLVAGRSATTVIVAAAPPARWHSEGSLLRRAINAFTT